MFKRWGFFRSLMEPGRDSRFLKPTCWKKAALMRQCKALMGSFTLLHRCLFLTETLIDPCIKGTQNVLNSCLKASSVKRVVFTSSSSTVRYRDDSPQIFSLNESHWSDIEYCKRHNLWYAYAKTVAEKEAWRISKENGIDLVSFIPSFVVGPLLAPEPSSTLLLIQSIVKEEKIHASFSS
uniref:NAD-dependent epimerase/dehydratase domain-containing protein n=1 Tax=Salix viminalis TaxID=40686 RepID=A0A6N2NGM7_SALVM